MHDFSPTDQQGDPESPAEIGHVRLSHNGYVYYEGDESVTYESVPDFLAAKSLHYGERCEVAGRRGGYDVVMCPECHFYVSNNQAHTCYQ